MEALSRNWGWLLALGILMIILGVFAIGAPAVATIAVQIMLGWLLVIGGIAEGIHAFMAQGWRGFLLELLSAILYLAVGVLLLVNPVAGALALTVVLAVFLIVEGIFKVIMALRVRDHRGWGWLLASGILSLILGLLIWADGRRRVVGDRAAGRHPAAVHRLVAGDAGARRPRPPSGDGAGDLSALHSAAPGRSGSSRSGPHARRGRRRPRFCGARPWIAGSAAFPIHMAHRRVHLGQTPKGAHAWPMLGPISERRRRGVTTLKENADHAVRSRCSLRPTCGLGGSAPSSARAGSTRLRPACGCRRGASK